MTAAAPALRRRSASRRVIVDRVLLYGAAVLLALWTLVPIYLIALAAFSERAAIYEFPKPLLPTRFSTDTMSFFVNSTGVLMAEVAQGLSARGHAVSVLTAFPHYEQFRVWDAYRGKLFQRTREQGLDITRLYVFANGKKQNMNYRLLSYLSFNALAGVRWLLTRNVGLFAEAKYLRASYTSNVKLSPVTRIEGDYAAGHILVGSSFHF